MIQIASEPLAKNYVAGVSSRSFFVSYFCYILILVIPATILVNIQYSWPSYKRQLIQPTLTYYAYQISCLNDAGILVYNSNLQAGIQKKDYASSVSVGVQGKKLKISGQVFASGLKSCSIQVYLSAKLGDSAQVLTHLPLNFATTNEASFLSSVELKGTISLRQSKPLSQSSLLSINQTQLGTYPYSFSTDFRDSGDKSIMLDTKTLYNKISLSATSTNFFSFVADYRVTSEINTVESSLIDKLRVFIPIFMYLCLFVWWLVIDPLINWMLRNKVYSAKTVFEKFKKD